jgi:hypothetical protein
MVRIDRYSTSPKRSTGYCKIPLLISFPSILSLFFFLFFFSDFSCLYFSPSSVLTNLVRRCRPPCSTVLAVEVLADVRWLGSCSPRDAPAPLALPSSPPRTPPPPWNWKHTRQPPTQKAPAAGAPSEPPSRFLATKRVGLVLGGMHKAAWRSRHRVS